MLLRKLLRRVLTSRPSEDSVGGSATSDVIASDKELLVTAENIEQCKDIKCIGYTYISPMDFLGLTLPFSSAPQIEQWIEEEKPFYLRKFGDWADVTKYNQLLREGKINYMPFLTVDEDTGKVVGHEGRHRAAAIIEAGGDRMPVAIRLRDKVGNLHYYDSDPVSFRKTFLGLDNIPAVIKGEANQHVTWSLNRQDWVPFYSTETSRAPGPELNANFWKWFGKSVIVNADGSPKVMYHGTSRDFKEFKQKQAGAVFLTDDPNFAEGFSQESEDWMLKNIEQFATPEQLEVSKRAAIRKIREHNKGAPKSSVMDLIEHYKKTDEWLDEIRLFLHSHPSIMPLYVRCEHPFDYESEADIEALMGYLQAVKYTPSSFAEDWVAHIKVGSWDIIEKPEVQRAFHELGHDGFWVKEGGKRNLAVYGANQVKSAVGNNGSWSLDSNDITAGAKIPAVLYHGSNQDFEAFDFSAAKDGAHWFTDNERLAGMFGTIRAYRVTMDNPLLISEADLEAEWDKEHPTGEQDDRNLLYRDFVHVFVARAKEAGFDGLIITDFVDHDITSTCYLPFSADQIKLAEVAAAGLPTLIRSLLAEPPWAGRKPFDINNGECEEFANEVAAVAASDKVHAVGFEEFQLVEGGFDWSLLEKHWPKCVPPAGWTREQLDESACLWGHVWVTDGQKHFDAECPDGVDSFFDLPFSKLRLKEFRESNAADGVPQNSLGEPVVQDANHLAAFTAWFKQSKVVDDQGRPLVLYHGTTAANVILRDGFDPARMGSGNDQYGAGFYFTNDKSIAHGYKEPGTDRRTGERRKPDAGHEAGVLEVYLSLQNPIILKDDPDSNTIWEQFPPLKRLQVEKLIKGAPNWDDPDGALSNFGDAHTEGLQRVLRKVINGYTGGVAWTICNDFYGDDNNVPVPAELQQGERLRRRYRGWQNLRGVVP
jgi:hypothetical protein